MLHITFVKTVLANGLSCDRCAAVSRQLRSDGLMSHINHLIVADYNDTDSIGIRLAKQHSISQIPFFMVEDELGQTNVFQDYQKFKHFIQN